MKPEIFEAAKCRLENLKKIRNDIKKQQINEPEGSLRISTHNGKIRTYRKFGDKSKKDQYIPQSEHELACRLARKGYLDKALTLVDDEIDHLEKYVDDCTDNTVEILFGKLSSLRKEMIVPLVETDEQFVDRWENQTFIQKPFGNSSQAFETKRGDIVRSKSELIIADELFYAGIPYRYERRTSIGNVPVFPDFTVLNTARRKEFIWEHLGKLDDPDYADNTAVKLNNYLSNGYYPGINMILTWETSRTPIKPELVRDLISIFIMK